jgi:hypothetical protein
MADSWWLLAGARSKKIGDHTGLKGISLFALTQTHYWFSNNSPARQRTVFPIQATCCAPGRGLASESQN